MGPHGAGARDSTGGEDLSCPVQALSHLAVQGLGSVSNLPLASGNEIIKCRQLEMCVHCFALWLVRNKLSDLCFLLVGEYLSIL